MALLDSYRRGANLDAEHGEHCTINHARQKRLGVSGANGRLRRGIASSSGWVWALMWMLRLGKRGIVTK